MKHLQTIVQPLVRGFSYMTTFYILSYSVLRARAQQFGGDVPSVPGTAEDDVRSSVTTTLNFVLTFLALAAVVFVIVGGIRILAAGGNEEQVTKGRKMIIYAVIGLIIVFFARTIVGFITTELSGEF
jgi:hypothetical protein